MADQPKKRGKADDTSRFDDVLRRMLSTPPVHKEAKTGGNGTKRKRAK